MTTIPQPLDPTKGYTGVWDAWNRLIDLQSGDENVESCLYDGMNRRVKRCPLQRRADRDSGISFTATNGRCWRNTSPPHRSPCRSCNGFGASATSTTACSATANSGTLDAASLLPARRQLERRGLYNRTGRPSSSATPTRPTASCSSSTPASPHSGNVSAYSWETLYCGYRYDAAVGLYLARNRWLESQLGCWIAENPLGLMSDSNVFRYAGGNPMSVADPSGLANEKIVLKVFKKDAGECGEFDYKISVSIQPTGPAIQSSSKRSK